jgi:uncharacterized protein YkwD
MRLALFLACLAAAPLLASCSTDIAKRVPPAQVSISSGDAGEAATLISRYRVAQGLSPVSADARLNKAAEVQARAVAEAGELSHGAFATRMASFGIAGASAENLTAGPRSVAAAVSSWKASPRHNDNLLMPEARHIGLARADTPGAGYGRYWALVLSSH